VAADAYATPCDASPEAAGCAGALAGADWISAGADCTGAAVGTGGAGVAGVAGGAGAVWSACTDEVVVSGITGSELAAVAAVVTLAGTVADVLRAASPEVDAVTAMMAAATNVPAMP